MFATQAILRDMERVLQENFGLLDILLIDTENWPPPKEVRPNILQFLIF